MFNYFLDTAAAVTTDGATDGNMLTQIIQWVVLIGGFALIYFFLIHRPQKKQTTERTNMLDKLQVGDEITTTGGIIGKVISIKEETVMIETGSDKTKIRILKSSVRNIDVKAEDAE